MDVLIFSTIVYVMSSVFVGKVTWTCMCYQQWKWLYRCNLLVYSL